jgi:hypothetical protein
MEIYGHGRYQMMNRRGNRGASRYLATYIADYLGLVSRLSSSQIYIISEFFSGRSPGLQSAQYFPLYTLSLSISSNSFQCSDK